jgi:hypothetical protein
VNDRVRPTFVKLRSVLTLNRIAAAPSNSDAPAALPAEAMDRM